MKKYHVLINGQNFLINKNGKVRKHGFYQNFFIETLCIEDAIPQIIEDVRKDKVLVKMIQNSKKDSPRIDIEEVNELNTFDGLMGLEIGRKWYVEAKWWQFWK